MLILNTRNWLGTTTAAHLSHHTSTYACSANTFLNPLPKKKNVAILYRKNNFFNRLLPFFPPSPLPLPPHPPQKHLLTKILHALHALRTLHTLHTHHATACRYEEYKRHKYPNGVPSFGRRAGGGAVPKKMTEAETMELYESKDGANPNPNPKPKP